MALYKRHIPIIGFDFIENKKLMLRNIYSQVSDLLNNAYEIYYLKNLNGLKINKRARKLLSRSYEAVSFISLIDNCKEIKNLKREIYLKLQKVATMQDSLITYYKVVRFYKKEIQSNFKSSVKKTKTLRLLLDNKIKANIENRLEDYWKTIGLPYKWISPILEILCKYNNNENLAIRMVRKKYKSRPTFSVLLYQ